jgi:predicted O-linked N-acetylglucosamine transferase (SPINDLY family)
MTSEQALQTALEHHQAGRRAEAEALYRAVLAQRPDHPDALHLLGVLAWQANQTDAAIALIGQAIAASPGIAQYHANLGEAYRQSGRWTDSVASLRQAIALRPDDAEIHNKLGAALEGAGQPDEAIAAYRRAIVLDRGHAWAHNNLGNALCTQGRLDEAITALEQAIACRPDFAEAYTNLGNALKQHQRLDEAMGAYRRAIALRPDLAEAHNNLGVVVAEFGRLDQAIAAYNQALALRPDYAEAHNNLGIALKESGRLEAALTAFGQAVGLRPGMAEAHANLGNALKDAGDLDQAIASLQRAIALAPGGAQAHNNLGNAFKEQGRLDEALACFRQAVALKPDFAAAGSNLLFTLHCHPDHDAAALLAESRRWARQFAAPLAAQVLPHPNDRTPDRRLRIGFLSPDLSDHPVGRLLVPLFSARDRRTSEFVVYSDVRRPDATTEKLRSLADVWNDTLGFSDARLAELVRHDAIDILVDTTLHTAHNRLLVFARKPAPVQVTMLGLPSTTGLETIDARLTDAHLDPPGLTDGDYSERSIRLPHCFWCYEPPEQAGRVRALPAIAERVVTFGCLNQLAKVSRPALRLWVEILRSLPGSRLVMHSRPGSHLETIVALFEEAGVARDRLGFIAPVPLNDYYQLYHRLDLCLDPFPFSGGVTTMDGLWMGVPAVTLAGRTAVGRGGASLLANVGLPELVARTPEEYRAIAVRWASDRPALAALREGLRDRMMASALMDRSRYAKEVEAAFRRLWMDWCRS